MIMWDKIRGQKMEVIFNYKKKELGDRTVGNVFARQE